MINTLKCNEKLWNSYLEKERKKRERLDRINSGSDDFCIRINIRHDDDDDDDRTESSHDKDEDDDSEMKAKDQKKKPRIISGMHIDSEAESGDIGVDSGDNIDGLSFGADWKEPHFDDKKVYNLKWEGTHATMLHCAVAVAHLKAYKQHKGLELLWDDIAMNNYYNTFKSNGIYLYQFHL